MRLQKNGGNKLLDSIKSKLKFLLPPTLLIAVNIFIFGPATIYKGNTSEFSLNFIDILGYYFLPFIAVLLVILLIGIFLSRRYLALYISLIFSIGLLLWLQGNILVWEYGLLDGQVIDWSTHSWQGLADAGFWLIFLLAACVLPED